MRFTSLPTQVTPTSTREQAPTAAGTMLLLATVAAERGQQGASSSARRVGMLCLQRGPIIGSAGGEAPGRAPLGGTCRNSVNGHSRFKTIHRSRAGAARDGDTPCATSTGTGSAACCWRRTFLPTIDTRADCQPRVPQRRDLNYRLCAARAQQRHLTRPATVGLGTRREGTDKPYWRQSHSDDPRTPAAGCQRPADAAHRPPDHSYARARHPGTATQPTVACTDATRALTTSP